MQTVRTMVKGKEMKKKKKNTTKVDWKLLALALDKVLEETDLYCGKWLRDNLPEDSIAYKYFYTGEVKK